MAEDEPNQRPPWFADAEAHFTFRLMVAWLLTSKGVDQARAFSMVATAKDTLETLKILRGETGKEYEMPPLPTKVSGFADAWERHSIISRHLRENPGLTRADLNRLCPLEPRDIGDFNGDVSWKSVLDYWEKYFPDSPIQ